MKLFCTIRGITLLISIYFTFISIASSHADLSFFLDEERIVELNLDAYKDIFAQAPFAAFGQKVNSDALVSLPILDGESRLFRMVEYDLVAPNQKRTEGVKTYKLFGIDSDQTFGHVTLSPYGLLATLFTDQGEVGIEPVDKDNPIQHRVFSTSGQSFGFEHTHELNEEHMALSGGHEKSILNNGTILRQFTMAIITTGEYGNLHGSGGNTAAVEAVIQQTIGALNLFYERELATTFVFGPRKIYFDGATDPFPPNVNRTAAAAIECQNEFAVNSFDIGHVLHSSGVPGFGGGVAGIGVLCDDMLRDPNDPNSGYLKGAGWSSVEDAATLTGGALNLFAHEIGHMFNMTHTFNGSGGDCTPFIPGNSPQGNQDGNTAFEIGSGITIMSYQGLCSADQNVPQAFTNENRFFHANSLERALMQFNEFPDCPVTSTIPNALPNVNANPCGVSHTIPNNTPFMLTGSGTDADGDQIYYCWEQYDEDGPNTAPTHGKIGVAAAQDPLAPLFRAYLPSPSPVRYYPELSNLGATNNYQSSFEALPLVNRDLTFRLTGRDYYSVGGAFDIDEMTIQVSTTGPFRVNAPSNGETIAGGTNYNVTWSNNTSSLCNNVAIKMSIDGGATYPIELNPSTANDGSESVLIPASVPDGQDCKIMVICDDNTCVSFFDVSQGFFTVDSDCEASISNICPASPVTVPGGTSVNLSQQEFGPTIVFENDPNASGLLQTTLAGRASASDATCTESCTFGIDSKIFDFTVGEDGDYSVSKISGGGTLWTVFETNSMSYDQVNPCNSNYIGSSGVAAQPCGVDFNNVPQITLPLTACTEYVIVFWYFSNTTASVYEIVGPGEIFGPSIAGSTPDYSYTYVAVNTANNQIAAQNNMADFGVLSSGSYEVYGASYYSGSGPTPPTVNPSSWVGQTIGSVISSDCAYFSGNKRPVTVEPPTGTPVISIAATDANKNEGDSGNTTFEFTVTRTGDLSMTSTVQWEVQGSGANPANATDFGGFFEFGSEMFTSGQSQKTILIDVSGDTTPESDETFIVLLSSPTNATLGTPSATGTILDDDTVVSTPEVSIAATDANKNEGNSGTTDFVFTLTRTGSDLSSPSIINWSVDLSASAADGSDFSGNLGSNITFASGETTKTLTIGVNGDTTVEPDEDFEVDISAGTNATIGTATATGTILNDDGGATPPEVSISATDANKDEGNSGTTDFVFTLTRTGDLTNPSTITWGIDFPSSAADATDFSAPFGTNVNFAANEATKTIIVNVNGDTSVEPDEDFEVDITSNTNATIGTGTATGTILNDDSNGGPCNSFTYNTPIAIPDDDPVGVSTTVGATGLATSITDVNLTVKATHTWVGDLIVTLESPGGVTSTVVFNRLCQGVDNIDITFDDQAVSPTTCPVDDMATELPANPLSVFNGLDPNGDWTLTVSDNEGQDTGTLDEWTIEICAEDPCTPPTFSASFNSDPSCAGNDGSLDLFASSNSANPLEYSIDDGATWQSNSLFSNLSPGNYNAVVREMGNPTCLTVNPNNPIVLTQTPDNLYSDSPAILIDAGTSINATTIPVSGVNGTIQSVFLEIEGEIGFGDLVFVSPEGSFLPLQGSTCNSEPANVHFNDNSQDPYTPCNYENPNGNLKVMLPFNPLSTFMGEDPNGDWALVVISGFVTIDTWSIGICVDPLPELGLDTGIAAPEGNSGTTNVTHTVNRTGDLSAPSSVDWTVSFGTADASDFVGGVPPSGTVNFAANDATVTFDVPVSGDTSVEPDETYMITLSNPSNGAVVTPTVTSTIINDDTNTTPVSFSGLYSPNVPTSTDGASSSSTLTVSGLVGNIADLDIELRGYTAQISELTGKLVSPMGTEVILFDGVCSSEEDYIVEFDDEAGALACPLFGTFQPSNPLSAFDGENPNGVWTLTIENSNTQNRGSLENWALFFGMDGSPTTEITLPNNPVFLQEANGGATTSFDINVTRSGDLNVVTTVDYFVTGLFDPNVSSVNALDFVGGAFPSSSLTFNNGESTKVISIPVIGDDFLERDEAFIVVLSNSSNAGIIQSVNEGIVQDDDPLTGNCSFLDNPTVFPISSTGTPTVTSTITFSGLTGVVDEVLVDMGGEHTWITDLNVDLISPTGTRVTLFEDVCNQDDNFAIAFSDRAANALSCPIRKGVIELPQEALSALNGEDPNGVWTLEIFDDANQDGGELSVWSLEICTVPGGPPSEVLDFVEGDYVTGQNPNLPLGNSARTMEARVKIAPASAFFEVFMNYGTTSPGLRSSLMINPSGNLYFAGQNADAFGTSNLRDGCWHHVAATYDGTTVKLYVDGIEESSTARSLNTTGDFFDIGRRIGANSELFDGQMNEVRVWDFAKTSAQINAQKDIELVGNEAGLVAYYNFNQGNAGGNNASTTTLTDISPSGADGTLNDFALTGATSNWVLMGANGPNCAPPCPPTLAVPGTIGSDTYEAQNEITSDGTVPTGNDVIFTAPETTLEPNFEVELGGLLEILQTGCVPLKEDDNSQGQ